MAVLPQEQPSGGCLSEETASAFVDGLLGAGELRELEVHIGSCADCDRFVAALAQLADSPELSSSRLAVRDQVGRYEIIEPVGSGAMGVVYRAHDPELDRDVALKLLRGTGGDHSERGARRLLAEARAMRHPNVIAVHDIGSFQGEVFIAMDLIDGSTLREWSRSARPAEIVDAYVSAGRGLAAAHRAGLIHRDFKPDNVLVDKSGHVVVTDFGLARAATATRDAAREGSAASDLSLTATGAVIGTPLYMAPEQAAGEADARSDQFSFAVSLWEACAGKRPFIGDDLEAIVDAIRAGKLRGTPQPSWLEPLLRRALAAEPDRRFESMNELVEAIADRRRPRRAGLTLVAAVAIVALVGGVLAFVATRDRSATACAALGVEVGAVWNESRQAQLVAAVTSGDEPYAADAARAISQRIDERSAAWLAHRTASCQAAANETLPTEVIAGTNACLREALTELDATTEVIIESKAAAARRGVEIVDRLDPLERCAVDGPTTAPMSPEAQALAETISRARALHDTGRYRPGLEALGDAGDRAAALAEHRLESRARHLECAIRHRLGEVDAAEKACHKSAVAAAAGGHADRAAHAWTLLVGLVARDKGKYEDADRWADYARAAVDRAGRPLRLVAALEGTLGVVAKQRGKYDEALAHYERSIELHRRAYGDDDMRFARSLNNLAILEGVLGHSEDALEHHQRALAIKEAKLGSLHPSVAASLTNLGLIHRGANDDLARPLFERALAIAEKSLIANHPTTTAIRSNLGLLEYRNGNLAAADTLISDALVGARLRAKAKPHPTVASLLDNLGLVRRSMGKSEEAATLHREALVMRRSIFGDEHDHVAIAANNLAIALGDSGKHDEALALFEEALAIRTKALGSEHADLIDDLLGIGQSHLSLGAPRAALSSLERAAKLLATSEVAPAVAAAVRLNLAEALRATAGDAKRAADLARSALEHYASASDGSAEATAARELIAHFGSATKR